MKKSAKRLLGVVFTLALMTILACGAFAAKPAVELTDVYFTVDSADGVTPTICFRNNWAKPLNTLRSRWFRLMRWATVHLARSADILRCRRVWLGRSNQRHLTGPLQLR